MGFDGEFLFDNQLVSGIELLIKESKKELILISPFIDFDPKIRTALKAKQSEKDFSLIVVLGKNEGDYYKSIKKESLEFLMEFPCVEVRYDKRIHAKVYQNDFDFIVTSMNLYNFSLTNNIEFGVRFSHRTSGLIGKVRDASSHLVDQGISTIKENVFGGKAGVDPLAKFQEMIANSTLLYKTTPVLASKGGIAGALGNVVVNLLSEEKHPVSTSQPVQEKLASNPIVQTAPSVLTQPIQSNKKLVSATKLSKELGVSAAKLKAYFEKLGYLSNDEITELGRSKGLEMLKGQYGPYVGYPAEMEELKKKY